MGKRFNARCVALKLKQIRRRDRDANRVIALTVLAAGKQHSLELLLEHGQRLQRRDGQRKRVTDSQTASGKERSPMAERRVAGTTGTIVDGDR